MDSEIAGIAATGATWLRSALRWDSVEPVSANRDDWSRSDRIVADTRRAGVSVIFNVEGAPDWAGGRQTGEFSTDPELYAHFVAKVAARYRGRVRVYELGNEPNLTAYVRHPDAVTYAKILEAAYPAVKAADPSAFVLTAGLAGGRDRNGNVGADTYLSELYRNGAKGFFDALAFHPYTYPRLPTEDASAGGRDGRNWSKMLRVRSIMVQNGDASKPIWITEFGAPTNGPGGVSQQQQAAIMQNGFQLWKTYAWGGVICWFDYRDKGTDTSTHKDFFGIITNSGARKASYATYAALARG
jgi:endo-1,4-beta-mannosidase